MNLNKFLITYLFLLPFFNGVVVANNLCYNSCGKITIVQINPADVCFCKIDQSKITTYKDLEKCLQKHTDHLQAKGKPFCQEQSNDYLGIKDKNLLKGRTIHVSAVIPGIHGGVRYIVEKSSPDLDWDDRSDNPGQQGSPLMGAHAMSGKLGEFFGFQKIDQDHYMIPSMDELNNGIDQWNQLHTKDDPQSPLKIFMKFYHPQANDPDQHKFVKNDNGAVEATHYLQNFAMNIVDGRFTESSMYLPVDDQGHYFHHDINFHTSGSLLIPQQHLKYLAAQSKYVIELKNFFEMRYPQLVQKHKMEEVFKELIDFNATIIDGKTASITQTLMYHHLGFSDKDNLIRALIRVGDARFPSVRRNYESYIKYKLKNGIKSGTFSLFRATVGKAMKEFIKLHQDEEAFNLSLPGTLDDNNLDLLDKNFFEREITFPLTEQRYQDMKLAAEKLCQQKNMSDPAVVRESLLEMLNRYTDVLEKLNKGEL